jgi:hypothetical protein
MTGKVARLESKTSLEGKEKPKTCLGLLIPINIKWTDYWSVETIKILSQIIG